MIPADWIRHHRADGDLIGYLRPTRDAPGRFQPVTVFGSPLGDPADEEGARACLDRGGLAYLTESWLLTLPGRAEPVTVQIVEAGPDRLRLVGVDRGAPTTRPAPTWTLDVPTTPDRLTRH
ncbi:hypothetical protein [Streptomyces sp. RFCAC02]|uniref:hypothetical protein n=1 Tax=Streptomyces sp. RFCAC02 TaxID=2499143 RepID=UPI0010201A9E|nr:hypothetical protein [Streptomyces sp. RFCAC02]